MPPKNPPSVNHGQVPLDPIKSGTQIWNFGFTALVRQRNLLKYPLDNPIENSSKKGQKPRLSAQLKQLCSGLSSEA